MELFRRWRGKLNGRYSAHGWSHLPQHIVEWRANLPLAAVAQWHEEGDRRSLENARKAVSWDAAAICEMRSKIAGRGNWPCYARHMDALVLRFWERRGGGKRRK